MAKFERVLKNVNHAHLVEYLENSFHRGPVPAPHGAKQDVCVNDVQMSFRVSAFTADIPVLNYTVITHNEITTLTFLGTPYFPGGKGALLSDMDGNINMLETKVDTFLSAYNPDAIGDKNNYYVK